MLKEGGGVYCMSLSLWWVYLRFPGHSEHMGFNAVQSLKVKQNKTINLFPFCIFPSNFFFPSLWENITLSKLKTLFRKGEIK